ncbi:helix-turn-helix transcriptional regulator [Pedococcus sp. 2YAF34]|uniref:helix-turn-helix transcriptional regulator n=1 Tax=Pedococcus sp. 2YAF34 TaxID=3233032 RepID=UPI003F9E989F
MTTADGGEAERHDLFRRVGRLSATVNGLTALEPQARRSVWSILPSTRFQPHDASHELNERSAQRGLDLRTVVSPHCLTVNPLMSSIDPAVRVGHVFTTFILVDGSAAVVFGPPGNHGEPTAWRATRSDVLGAVRDIWTRVWASSRPAVPPGDEPPFTRRQVLVASRLAAGTKDAAIARELGVSVRTVVSEVAAIVERLGARGRLDAVHALGAGLTTPATGPHAY